MKQLAERVFLETGYDGVNVGAVLTRKGFLCIDTPSYPRDARDWRARLQQIDPRPVAYTILTNCHGDRILNTRWFGAPLVAQEHCRKRLETYDRRFPQPLLDSLQARNPDAGRDLVAAPVEQVNLSFGRDVSLYNVEAPCHVRSLPGPMACSVIVELPREQLVFCGDLLVADTHPALAEASLDHWLRSLTQLQEMAGEGLTLIPGRGPVDVPGALPKLMAFLADVRERLLAIGDDPLPRSVVNELASDLIDCYPLHGAPHEWVAAQLRLGIEKLLERRRAFTAVRS
jgi:glyoxylase-like metal-dependent hydrolase (beta-lactamase superfamily II)